MRISTIAVIVLTLIAWRIMFPQQRAQIPIDSATLISHVNQNVDGFTDHVSLSPTVISNQPISLSEHGEIPTLPTPGKKGMAKFLPSETKASLTLTQYLEKIENKKTKLSDTASLKEKIAKNPLEYFQLMNILMATLPKEKMASRAMIIGVVNWMPIAADKKLKFLEKHVVKAPRPLELESLVLIMNSYPKLESKRVLLMALVEPGISRDRYYELLNAYSQRYPNDFDNTNVAEQNRVLQVSAVLPRVLSGAQKQ